MSKVTFIKLNRICSQHQSIDFISISERIRIKIIPLLVMLIGVATLISGLMQIIKNMLYTNFITNNVKFNVEIIPNYSIRNSHRMQSYFHEYMYLWRLPFKSKHIIKHCRHNTVIISLYLRCHKLMQIFRIKYQKCTTTS